MLGCPTNRAKKSDFTAWKNTNLSIIIHQLHPKLFLKLYNDDKSFFIDIFSPKRLLFSHK